MEITRKSFKAYLKDLELHADDEDMSGLNIDISEAGMKIDITFVDEQPKIMTAEQIFFKDLSNAMTNDERILERIKIAIEETHKRYKKSIEYLKEQEEKLSLVAENALNLIIKEP